MEATFLGILQGLAEFLPISSSGHLCAAQYFFGMDEGPVAMNVALHLATLLVIAVYYRKAIVKLLLPPDAGYLLALAVATVPTGMVGLLIKSQEEKIFSGPGGVKLTAALLCVNGIWLVVLHRLGGRMGASDGRISLKQAAIIGVVQGVAALPGISRSGSTIGAGRLLGISGERATEFSLLASMPAIFGAGLLEARKIQHLPNPWLVLWASLLAAVGGWFAISLLRRIAVSGAWGWWGIYCAAAGAAILAYTGLMPGAAQ